MNKEMMRSLARALGGRMKSVIAQVARQEASRFLRHLQERWREGATARPAPDRPALEPPPPQLVASPVAAPQAAVPTSESAGTRDIPKRARAQKAAPRRAAARTAARVDETLSSVDINTASRAELVALPGIGLARADAIMNGRPYANAAELVERRVLPKPVFTSLRERLRVE